MSCPDEHGGVRRVARSANQRDVGQARVRLAGVRPIFMTGAGSPELTQAAYRLADSCTNVITPVNAYLTILLAVLRRYIAAGLGTIIELMLPYCLTILVFWRRCCSSGSDWTSPLGPARPLHYPSR